MTNLLNQSVTEIKGIGDETAQSLAEMNINSIRNLLFHLPFRYEDYRLRDLAEVKHDEKVTIEGKVFKYKITPRTKPFNWADLEIINDRGQSITIFFYPRRQSLLKEIKRNLKLYKWIK